MSRSAETIDEQMPEVENRIFGRNELVQQKVRSDHRRRDPRHHPFGAATPPGGVAKSREQEQGEDRDTHFASVSLSRPPVKFLRCDRMQPVDGCPLRAFLVQVITRRFLADGDQFAMDAQHIAAGVDQCHLRFRKALDRRLPLAGGTPSVSRRAVTTLAMSDDTAMRASSIRISADGSCCCKLVAMDMRCSDMTSPLPEAGLPAVAVGQDEGI